MNRRVQKINNSTKKQYVKKRLSRTNLNVEHEPTVIFDLRGLSSKALTSFRAEIESRELVMKTIKASLLRLVVSKEIKGANFCVTNYRDLKNIGELIDAGTQNTYYKAKDIVEHPIIVPATDTNMRMGKSYALIESFVPVKLVKGFITVSKETKVLDAQEIMTEPLAELLRVLKLPLKTVKPKPLAFFTNKTVITGKPLAQLLEHQAVGVDIRKILQNIVTENYQYYLGSQLNDYALIRLISSIISNMSTMKEKQDSKKLHQNSEIVLPLILSLLADKKLNGSRSETIASFAKKANKPQSLIEQLASFFEDADLEKYLNLENQVAQAVAVAPVVKAPVQKEPEPKEEQPELDLGSLF